MIDYIDDMSYCYVRMDFSFKKELIILFLRDFDRSERLSPRLLDQLVSFKEALKRLQKVVSEQLFVIFQLYFEQDMPIPEISKKINKSARVIYSDLTYMMDYLFFQMG